MNFKKTIAEIWDIKELYSVPNSYPAAEFREPGVSSLYYRGLDYMGKPTEVYAYYGVPEGETPSGGWPGIVLVHGGGGTAYPEYVKWWNRHGYAAITMDLEGHLPDRDKKTQDRPAVGTPGPSRADMWDDIEKPIDEQWFYHCISQIILAHSLIRSFPEVNPEKTGIAGVSWGAVSTCLVMGIDERLKFAVLIYGCAALAGSDAVFGDGLRKKTSAQMELFMKLWEGTDYLALAKIPSLWLNGTNDLSFPLDAWQKSIDAVKGDTLQRIEIRMPHGHIGFKSSEAAAFADGIVKGRNILPLTGNIDHIGNQISMKIECAKKIIAAELSYTLETGKRSDRLWKSIPIDIPDQTVAAILPEKTTAFFFNITTEDNLMLSSEYIELN